MLPYCRGHRELKIKLEAASSSPVQVSVLRLHQEGHFSRWLVNHSQMGPIPLRWCVWWHRASCAPEMSKPGTWLEGSQFPPGCHAGSQGREAGSCSEQGWNGTGSGTQIWNTPRSLALSWTCVDLGAALQSSDLVLFLASLYMQTIWWYSEPCLTLSSFSPLFTSCVDHTPAFSAWAEGKMSLLSSLILSFPPLLSAPGIFL